MSTVDNVQLNLQLMDIGGNPYNIWCVLFDLQIMTKKHVHQFVFFDFQWIIHPTIPTPSRWSWNRIHLKMCKGSKS